MPGVPVSLPLLLAKRPANHIPEINVLNSDACYRQWTASSTMGRGHKEKLSAKLQQMEHSRYACRGLLVVTCVNKLIQHHMCRDVVSDVECII